MRNLFAYTPTGPVPPYLSVNEIGGEIVVTTRGKGIGGATGPTAEITLPPDQVDALCRALMSRPTP